MSWLSLSLECAKSISTWYTEPRAELIKAMSLLKRNALAAPFEKAFALQKQLEANPPAQDAVAVKQDLMSVHYR